MAGSALHLVDERAVTAVMAVAALMGRALTRPHDTM
jgi:hypothetical protein